MNGIAGNPVRPFRNEDKRLPLGLWKRKAKRKFELQTFNPVHPVILSNRVGGGLTALEPAVLRRNQDRRAPVFAQLVADHLAIAGLDQDASRAVECKVAALHQESIAHLPRRGDK